MATLPNNSIGLNSANIADANLNSATWNYISGKSSSPDIAKIRPKFRRRPDAPTESLHRETGEAPIPEGTVGKDAILRRSILQMSIAPHISAGAISKIKSPSRLG